MVHGAWASHLEPQAWHHQPFLLLLLLLLLLLPLLPLLLLLLLLLLLGLLLLLLMTLLVPGPGDDGATASASCSPGVCSTAPSTRALWALDPTPAPEKRIPR